MGDVGKVVIGGILTVAGIAMQFFPPTAPFAPFVMYAGSLIMQSGLKGLNEEQASIQSNTTGQQVDLPIIYGKDVRVGHTNADVFTYGDQGDMLYIVGAIGVTSDITYAGISAVKEIYNDSENAVMASDVDGLLLDTFTVDQIYGQTTGVRDEWSVTLPVWVSGLKKDAYYYSYHLHSGGGTGSGPVVDEMLTTVRPEAWPSTSQGVGIAYAVNHFVFSEERYTTFPQLTYLVDGNVIKDFRDDQPVDSTNPALVLYDYLVSKRYGLGLDPADIDVSGTFTEVANWCELTTTMAAPYGKLIGSGWGLQTETANDTTITANGFANSSIKSLFEYLEIGDVIKITSGDNAGSSFEVTGWTPGGYGQVIITVSPAVPVANTFMSFEVYRGTVATPYEIPNAEISGILRTASSHKDNIDKILDAMRGKLYWQDGKIKLWVRKPETAQTTVLDASTNVSDIQIARAGVSEKYNSVSAKYVDPAQEHEVEEIVWPPSTTTNLYLAEDNGFPSRLGVEFPLVSNAQVIWKYCEVALKESRQDTTVELTATEDALQFEIGDVVKLTDDTVGWTEKEFWVLSMTLTSDNLIRMVLKEYDSSVYTSSGQMTESGTPGSDLPSPLYMAPPTNLTLLSDETTKLLIDGQAAEYQQIKVGWTTSSSTNLLKEEVFYRQTGDPIWTFGGFRYKYERDSTLNTQTLLVGPVEPETGHDVKVEAISNLGVRSTPLSGTITTGSVEPIGGGTGGSCPNIMQQDAIFEQGGLDPQTGTVVQYTYIDAWLNGITPGETKVSFCGEIWVGTGDQDDPILVGCAGKLGLLESGLIWSMDRDGTTSSLKAEWQKTSTVRATVTGTEYYVDKAPYVTTMTKRYAFEFPRIGLGANGYMAAIYNPSNTGWDKLFVAARWLNEGVSMIQSDGSIMSYEDARGTQFLGLTPPGSDLYKQVSGVGYYTSQPTMNFVTDYEASTSAYQFTGGSTYGGLFNGGAVSILYRGDGTSLGSVGALGRYDRQLIMFVAPGEIWYDNGLGGNASTDTTHQGPYWVELGWDNETGEHAAGPGGAYGKNIDVGMGWWYDVHIQKDYKIRVKGLTQGDYVKIGTGTNWAYSPVGADANGEVDVYVQWGSNQYTANGITSDLPGGRTWNLPLIGSFQIWDDKPWSGGTMTYECASNPFQFYGGDRYVYDSTGSLTDTGTTVTNVSGVLRMQFIKADGSVISTVETAEYSGSTPGVRTGVSGTLVPSGTSKIRISIVKKGTAAGWAKSRFVQLNAGDACCSFSPPTTDWQIPVEYDTDPSGGTDPGYVVIPGGETVDLSSEHRQGGANLLAESRDERTITAGTGNLDGDDYPRVTLSEMGLQPGDVISIRGKVKAT